MRPLALLVFCFALLGVRPAAAQILPPYPDMWSSSDGPGDEDVAVHTTLISMATVTTIGFNLSDHSPSWAGPAGFLGGTLQVVYGSRQKQDGVAMAINYFFGGAAMLTSLSALARHDDSRTSSGVHVVPLLAWDEERRPLAGAYLRF